MSEKPSLQEIASMPFPASVEAMRKYYNREWGKPVPDGAKWQKYSVEFEIEYTGRDFRIVDVEAYSAEEAEEKAGELVDDGEYDEIEIISTKAKVKGSTDA